VSHLGAGIATFKRSSMGETFEEALDLALSKAVLKQERRVVGATGEDGVKPGGGVGMPMLPGAGNEPELEPGATLSFPIPSRSNEPALGKTPDRGRPNGPAPLRGKESSSVKRPGGGSMRASASCCDPPSGPEVDGTCGGAGHAPPLGHIVFG
jgi:hypothetical protein